MIKETLVISFFRCYYIAMSSCPKFTINPINVASRCSTL